MHPRRPMVANATALALAPVLLLLIPSRPASAHGWVTSPPSRQELCASRSVPDCGPIVFEPQSVEAPKGARSCSGGSQFAVLDDEGRGWPATPSGSTVTIRWRLTAAHRTTTWQYFVDGELHKTIDEGNRQPDPNTTHTLSGLPSGRHKILAIWNIADTPMAFYNCIDLQVGSGGDEPPPPSEPPPPPPPAPPPPACGNAWSPTEVYVGGNTVTHEGDTWRARWWTLGEEPGTTGQFGVWQQLGACEEADHSEAHESRHRGHGISAAGLGPEGSEAAGCSLASPRPAGATWAAGLLGLLLVLMRRRRS
jgi:MYXO-CTERM domain-containing protein